MIQLKLSEKLYRNERISSLNFMIILTLITGLTLVSHTHGVIDADNANVHHTPESSFIFQYHYDQYQRHKQSQSHPNGLIQPTLQNSNGNNNKKGSPPVAHDAPVGDDEGLYRHIKPFPYAHDPSHPQHREPEIRFGWKLVIRPTPIIQSHPHLIVKRIDESLNLTCTCEYVGTTKNESVATTVPPPMSSALGEEEPDLGPEQTFRLAWHIPIMPQNSKNRVSFSDFPNSKHLIVDYLRSSDEGEYECTANAIIDNDSDKFGLIPPLVESIQILVKPKKGSCLEPLVLCSSGECIAKRYMCDGRPDCKDRSDESFDNCGTYHPCDGKLRCSDGRCISPYWCCDNRVDKNCTVLVQSPCCAQLKHIPFLLETHYGPQPQHFNDMGFLQTTIYTVIATSMAFCFIITIMVIAICRVHIRRTAALSQHLQMTHPSSYPLSLRSSAPGPFSDHPGGGGSGGGMIPPYSASASGFMVTYNINNGVQFLSGRPVNPPPYSETPRLPPREGPPPPYCSVENLGPSANISLEQGLPTYTPSSQNSGAIISNASLPEAGPSTSRGLNHSQNVAVPKKNDNDESSEDSEDGGQRQPLLHENGDTNAISESRK